MLRYSLGNSSRRFIIYRAKQQSAVSLLLLDWTFSNFGDRSQCRSWFVSVAVFSILLTSAQLQIFTFFRVYQNFCRPILTLAGYPCKQCFFLDVRHSFYSTRIKVPRLATMFAITNWMGPWWLLKLWQKSLKWWATVLFCCERRSASFYSRKTWSKAICGSCLEFSITIRPLAYSLTNVFFSFSFCLL